MHDATYWENKWKSRTKEPPNRFAVRAYKLIKERKLKTLLDVGAGAGCDTLYFSRRGLTVTALDRSASGIAVLRSRNPRIRRVIGDIRTVNLKKDSFDVIYAHLILHYFDDRTTTRIFHKLYRTLKPDGLLFMKCKSTDDALYGRGVKVGEHMYRKGHVRHFFSKDYMAEKLKQFKVLKISNTSSVYHQYKSSFIEAIATK